MIEGTHKLGGAQHCREALVAARMGDPVTIERGTGALRFFDLQGRLLGTLTSRHTLAKRLEAGERVLHCSANSVYAADEQRPNGSITVRVATGADGEIYEAWPGPARSSLPKLYPMGLVGESHYQNAIGACRQGERLELWREIGNPHDHRAIAVKTTNGATIGYVPRDSWLQAVVHDEGCGATGSIKALYPGPPTAVVIEVAVTASPLGAADYAPPQAIARSAEPPAPASRSWMSRILGS